MATAVGFGTTLTWNSQTVTKLSNIGGYELSIGTVDGTNHQSTSAYKEKFAGLVEVSDITFEGFFDVTDTNGQVAMLTDAGARTSRTMVITGPSSAYTFTCTAFITKLKIGDFPIEGMIPFNGTLTITGVPSFAASTSNNVTALTVTTATLYPTFAQGTYDYVGVSTGDSVTFTATFAAGTAVLVSGSTSYTLTSTVESGAISLGADGTETDVTLTVTETGKIPKVYTFRMANAAA